MRLIENSASRETFTCDSIVLCRHGVDVSTLSQNLNQPLTEETKPDIRILGKEISTHLSKGGQSKVVIRHSNRLRAIQSAAIIGSELFDAGISTDIHETDGVREIYQGRFIIRNHVNGTEYKPLVNAWTVWQKKLDACELLYRFGDPLITNGIAQHPELTDWFQTFGENQAEFSLRLYGSLKTVFQTEGVIQIIVGHQASCSRVQRILSAASQLHSADDFNPGEFVRFLEKKGTRTTIDYACGVVVKKPLRDLVLSVLEKEINYLRSIS